MIHRYNRSASTHRMLVPTSVLVAGWMATAAFAQLAPPASPGDQSVPPANPPTLNSDARGTTPASPADLIAARQAEEPTPVPADVRNLLIQTVNAIITPVGDNSVAGQVSQADTQSLKGLEQSAALRQTIEQLQAAYKERFGTEFAPADTSATLLPEDSFRVGVAMAVVREPVAATQSANEQPASTASGSRLDQAQPASAINAPDGTTPSRAGNGTTPGATPTDVSRANASAPAAEATAPKLARRISVTLPESEGIPETSLKLAHESGTWKLDVPDGVSAQGFEQNLQKQLQQAMSAQWPEDAEAAGNLIARHVLIALATEGSTGQIGNAPARTPAERQTEPGAPPLQKAPADPAVGNPAPAAERQTYSERRAAERAERDARRAANRPNREQPAPEAPPSTDTPADKAPAAPAEGPAPVPTP